MLDSRCDFRGKRWCQKHPPGENVREPPTAVPKMLCGQTRARIFNGAAAVRSSSRFFARRSDGALRVTTIIRLCPHMAGQRPARLKESLRCMPKQTNGAGIRKSRPRLSETAVVTYQMPPAAGTAAERTSAEASSTSCGTVSTRTNCCTSPAAWLAVHVIALPDRLPIS